MKKLIILLTIIFMSSVGYSQASKKDDMKLVRKMNKSFKSSPDYNPKIRGIVTDDLYSYDIMLDYLYDPEYSNISYSEEAIDRFKSYGYTRMAFHYIDKVVYYEFY